ncbi:MAG: hypothetical protein M1836_007771 [Candelina mexicana]|nr:MAG: hypothetical protein M1836_007771 [Candelina mexicana]
MPVIDLSQVPDTQERKAFLLSQYGTGLQRYRLTHIIPETPPDSPLFEHIVTVPDDDNKRKGKDGSVDPVQPTQIQSGSTAPSDLSRIIGGLEDIERDAAIRRIQVSALQVGNEQEWTGTLLPDQLKDPAASAHENLSSHEPQLSFEEVNILLAELRSKGLQQLAALDQPLQNPWKLTPQQGITLPHGELSDTAAPGSVSAATESPSVRLQPTNSSRLGSAPILSSTPPNVNFVDVTLILSKPTLAPVLKDTSGPVPAVASMPSGMLAAEDPEDEPEAPIAPSRKLSSGSPLAELIDPYSTSLRSPTATSDVERVWPTFDLESEAFRARKSHIADEPTIPVIHSGYIDDHSTRETNSVFGIQNAAIALLFAYVVLTLWLRALGFNRRRPLAAWRKGFGQRAGDGGDKIA